MCKMLISVENGEELGMMEDVAQVCEAMLAFPLRFPGTRFYRGLQVNVTPNFQYEHTCKSLILTSILVSLWFQDSNVLNHQARKRFMSKLDKEIRERRKGLKPSREDFLQHLLIDDEGLSVESAKLSDAEIRDNILTMFIAGQKISLTYYWHAEIIIFFSFVFSFKTYCYFLQSQDVQTLGCTLHDFNIKAFFTF